MTPASAVAVQVALADRALLARVLVASRVQRRPEPPDASYLRDLIAGAYAALARLIERASGGPGLPIRLLAGVAAVLLAAAAALLARAWLAHRRRTRAGLPAATALAPGVAGEAGAGPAVEGDGWGAAAWRQELQRRLAARQVPEALRAAWWWLARSLAGAGAEATWTGGELLRAARREDLSGMVRQLDAMTFGPRPPAPEEVRQLAARLEESLR